MATSSSLLQRLEQTLAGLHKSLEALEELRSLLLELEEELLNEETSANPTGQDLRFLSIPEVCWKLATNEDSVYRLLRSGKIPSVTLGHVIKVRQADLEGYMKDQHHAVSVEPEVSKEDSAV